LPVRLGKARGEHNESGVPQKAKVIGTLSHFRVGQVPDFLRHRREATLRAQKPGRMTDLTRPTRGRGHRQRCGRPGPGSSHRWLRLGRLDGEYSPRISIQRKDEEVARRLEVVEFLRMDVPPARLHGKILLRPYRVADRGTLERRTDVEAPQLFELLV